MRINVSQEASAVLPELSYLLKLIAINKRIELEVVVSEDRANSVGPLSENTIQVSTKFISGKFEAQPGPDGFFSLPDGKPDYIGTAFYCLSCMQEYSREKEDRLGRFSFGRSYQATGNLITRNLVQECFDRIADMLGIRATPEKSSFFLSHDIDVVYGAYKEDGFYALKKGNIPAMLKLIFNAVVSRPDWLNIDQIADLESEYGCRSAFYFIMNKGKVGPGLENADYDFSSESIQKHVRHLKTKGIDVGLHKSLSVDSFATELARLDSPVIGNRYHYLKFNLPKGFDDIEDAGLQLDTSLGFSEHWGFRNSYGLPYNPWRFAERRPYRFLEVPLHIMDRTFFQKRMDVSEVESAIFDFFEKNRFNTVISVLWHNNFFTEYKYKGYLSMYRKILLYIKENKFQTMSENELVQKYNMQWQ